MPCFKDGACSKTHEPATHPFYVIEQHSVPIYEPEWGADEELCLLEGAENYGLGSWADIADHIGGYRTKEECRDHYIKTYIESPNFPLPANANIADRQLTSEISREDFQARKKRRIESRKEDTFNAPPAAPKQKPVASVPACHEVQGYMPGRLEFETEYSNDAEEAVQHMQFEPGDGVDLRTGELDPEMNMKLTVMSIYNDRLTSRADRKKIIFEHHLLDYKRNMNIEKKKTKEEKMLFDKTKPFTRMMNHDDWTEFSNKILDEHNFRAAIAQTQEWRRVGITNVKDGEKYEAEKQARAARPPPTGAFDRQGGVRSGEKKHEQKVIADATLELTAQELPERFRPIPQQPLNPTSTIATTNDRGNGPAADVKIKVPLTNGTTNTLYSSLSSVVENKATKTKHHPQCLPNTVPLRISNAADVQLLTEAEKEFCSQLRIQPKPYMAIKQAVIQEAMKNGGTLKRKAVKELCKGLDTARGSKAFDFFVHSGWISKA